MVNMHERQNCYEDLLQGTGLYINGQWLQTVKTIKVLNPSTREICGHVGEATEKDIQLAIDAASKARKLWECYAAKERASFLHKLAKLITERKEDLAHIIVAENGKPMKEAYGEVVYAVEFLSWFAEEGRRIYGRTISSPNSQKRVEVKKQPIGVVGIISAWNFPLALITKKLGAALAAGCPVIVKPSELTPLTANALFQLIDQCKFPPGVINLVNTLQPEIVSNSFFTNRDVRKISFTGSTKVGKLLVQGSAEQLKKVTLELGGHAPVILFEDADLDRAIEGCIASKFRNSGQWCMAANRIYVHQDIYCQFIKRFVQKVGQLKVGNSLLINNDVGPLMNEQQLNKIEAQISDAVQRGAEILTGGKRINVPPLDQGIFFEPTVLTNVTEEMKISTEETFGPVIPIFTFKKEVEVIQKANQTSYGLAAYFYTQDLNRAIRVSEQLEFGMIGINDPIPTSPEVPQGGMKESGIGREGGSEGIEDYLETKMVSTWM
jgi:succinate-semialdehyde dehydrogenase / glutarate-semialdehyde dehydrogenase